jgi:hypothetical protein
MPTSFEAFHEETRPLTLVDGPGRGRTGPPARRPSRRRASWSAALCAVVLLACLGLGAVVLTLGF